MPFSFTKLEIPEVLVIEPKVFPDSRGVFAELYKYPDFFRLWYNKTHRPDQLLEV